MKDFFAGVRSLGGLTLLEAMRQRLWLLVVLCAVGVLVAVPSLRAVDQSAQLKLSVSSISSVIGFVSTLLAILVIAASVRRDVDHRIGYMLFSKPLSRLSYLAGRWCGMIVGLIAVIVILSIVGAISIWLQLGHFPTVRSTTAASQWQSLDRFGGTADIRADRDRHYVRPQIGAGVQYTFNGLTPQTDAELLVKVHVRGEGSSVGYNWATLQVSARSTTQSTPRILDLHPESPYGATDGLGKETADGIIAVRHRADERKDLSQDYARLVLPGNMIGAEGSVSVLVTRSNASGVVGFHQNESVLVSRAGGGFVGNLFKAGVVSLAQAAVLASLALACAAFSGMGTALLACLTCYFAGNALPVVVEAMRYGELPVVLSRFLDVLLVIIPNFSAYPVASQLAASQAIEWSLVGSAWGYFGMYIAVFFVLSAYVFSRREM